MLFFIYVVYGLLTPPNPKSIIFEMYACVCMCVCEKNRKKNVSEKKKIKKEIMKENREIFLIVILDTKINTEQKK